jgi:hypothetical protein
MQGDADTSEAAQDSEALERQHWTNLATVAVVVLLCLLGMVVVRRIQAFLNSVGRSRTEEP